MISLMTNAITNEPCGLHRTFLNSDGTKISHGEKKMTLGNCGPIRLVPDEEVTLGIGIAEGIETSLAIMQRAGWQPVWAAGSAGGIAKFPVLHGIESLTIFPDADDKGASVKAAQSCAERWTDAGRAVRIVTPPNGKDWHDAAMRAVCQ
jgi:hypothetical protein